MSKELNKYTVLKPIGVMGERYEVGAEVKLSSDEAKNIGDEYVKLSKGETTDEVATPKKANKKA